jgi:plastocyanin
VNRSLLLVLAGAGAALALAACGGGAQPAAGGADPRVQATPSAAPTTAASPVAATSVAIANFAFSPAIVTLRAGSTVTWTNQDADAHTVALQGLAASQPLQNGDTYTHTFARPGSYPYICSIHPFMHGMVVVTAG